MKTFPIKELLLDDDVDGSKISTAKIIKDIVKAVDPVRGGIDGEDMDQRLRIIRAVKKLAPAASELVLEDADAENLARYVAAFKWGVVSEGIAEFRKDVIAAATATD